MRIKSSRLPLIILVLLLAIIALTIALNKLEAKPEDYSGMTEEEIEIAVQNKIDKMEVNSLAVMEERDRIEYYLGEFIKAVEKSNYAKAYNMLNEDFRNNFFKTEEDFKNYVKSKFPMMFSVEHTNIERNGDTYILWVDISDSLGGKNSKTEYNFVIKENDLNDFELSFSVK